ncbi:hypothetical protein NEOLEDRAFT_1144262 [Neolentinus lepideus HHB14362 ss-1]|uniref:Uncharacterized protein n=1 Tax=Neolentinus lepideus HHB14362 ss-1 TaxID=1314782 RepID=A0A165W5D4_9AGAM|nr:hypothetical protein NEOLEDRAFT_1144262 [Neolentinus lepideus HHB14362 ss-1]
MSGSLTHWIDITDSGLTYYWRANIILAKSSHLIGFALASAGAGSLKFSDDLSIRGNNNVTRNLVVEGDIVQQLFQMSEAQLQEISQSAAELSTKQVALPVAPSSNGRASGKPWKYRKTATVRSSLPAGVKTKKWEERMEKTKRAAAVKKLQTELKEEKQAEITRYAARDHSGEKEVG